MPDPNPFQRRPKYSPEDLESLLSDNLNEWMHVGLAYRHEGFEAALKSIRSHPIIGLREHLAEKDYAVGGYDSLLASTFAERVREVETPYCGDK